MECVPWQKYKLNSKQPEVNSFCRFSYLVTMIMITHDATPSMSFPSTQLYVHALYAPESTVPNPI